MHRSATTTQGPGEQSVEEYQSLNSFGMTKERHVKTIFVLRQDGRPSSWLTNGNGSRGLHWPLPHLVLRILVAFGVVRQPHGE